MDRSSIHSRSLVNQESGRKQASYVVEQPNQNSSLAQLRNSMNSTTAKKQKLILDLKNINQQQSGIGTANVKEQPKTQIRLELPQDHPPSNN